MTSYQSYSQRYSRQKSNSKTRTISPHKSISNINDNNHFLPLSSKSNNHFKIQSQSNLPVTNFQNNYSSLQQNHNQQTIGHTVAKLANRVDSIDIKITSLTNVVRLIQKYTETKDQQYEKQKENLQFKQKFNNFQFIQQNNHNHNHKNKNINTNNKIKNPFEMIDLDYNTRVKQFDLLTKRIKSQLNAVQSLRIGLCKQSSRKNLQTNCKTAINHLNVKQFQGQSQQTQRMSKDMIQDIHQMIENMQDALRDQLNRKIQVCMNMFKSNHDNKQINKQVNQISIINKVMLQEQIHTLTLNFNKMENQQHKNINFILKKVEDIGKQIHKINLIKFNINNENNQKQEKDQSSIIKKENKRKDRNQSLTPPSNRSQRSASINKNKSNKKKNPQSSTTLSLINNISQKSKVKEQQLKEAIRRKRQAKQKLKVK